MPPAHRLAAAVMSVALAAVFAGQAPAQSYHDAEHHFSIELPKGWQTMPKAELDQINRLIGARMLSIPVHYETGLRRTSSRMGSFPYVLVQTMKAPPSGASFEEMERALSVDFSAPLKDAQGKVSDIVRDMKVGQPALDRKNNRIIMHTESNVNGIGAAKGLSIGHLGKDNIIFIHCYSRAEDFEGSLGTFTHINDWFSFDKGYDFKPGPGSARVFSWQSVGRSSVIGGVVGLVVGLCGLFFRLVSQHGKKASIKSHSGEVDLAAFDRKFNDGLK